MSADRGCCGHTVNDHQQVSHHITSVAVSERVSSPEWIVSPAEHLGLASFAAVLVGQEQHNRAAFCYDRCNIHKFQGTLVCECEGYSGFALGAGQCLRDAPRCGN